MNMSRRLALALAFVFTLSIPPLLHSSTPQLLHSSTPELLPSSIDSVYAAVSGRFDRDAAMEVVRFMDRFWRLAGNPGFNASIDEIRRRLTGDGFVAHDDGKTRAFSRVDEFAAGGPGWDYSVGTVAIEDLRGREVLLSREGDRVSLCINSFSTPDEGVNARLVDVGSGASDADFAATDLRGAVVLGDAPIQRLWAQAVKVRGAAGVISTAIAPYIRPADPAQFTRDEQKDVFQWNGVPYDPAVKAFGFKASWRAASRMRQRLKDGPVNVHVTVKSAFYDGPSRSLIGEIRGRVRPEERIVLVAHVQEPGANDNASGSGTLSALASALVRGIRDGSLPPPDRTLTFIWADEVRGSRHWLTSRSADASGVQYMFALDMTGEDTSKTGGTFLIEKQPDPSAVWERPSDPHTEWGGGGVKAETLNGSLLNDVHLAICLRRARDTGWVVRTNPYEGGSDHTAFGSAGVPSVLDWHFTDRYYHTNQDRLDKVSAAEMANVGIAVATTAWFLASASPEDARSVVDLIEAAAARRLALERNQGRALVQRASDRPAAESRERDVMSAWVKWYGEALDSVLRLPAAGADDGLRARVAAAKQRLINGKW
jgi:aminopeptidase YwaD